MNKPKVYTSTELQRGSGKVLNEAFNTGMVEIHHRDRGKLLVMTEARLLELVSLHQEGKENGQRSNNLQS